MLINWILHPIKTFRQRRKNQRIIFLMKHAAQNYFSEYMVRVAKGEFDNLPVDQTMEKIKGELQEIFFNIYEKGEE